MFGSYYIIQTLGRVIYYIINDQMFVILNEFRFLFRGLKTFADGLFVFRAAVFKPCRKFLDRRRGDKDHHRIRIFLFDLSGSVDVDLKKHVFSFFQLLFDKLSRRAVIVVNVAVVFD